MPHPPIRSSTFFTLDNFFHPFSVEVERGDKVERTDLMSIGEKIGIAALTIFTVGIGGFFLSAKYKANKLRKLDEKNIQETIPISNVRDQWI